MAARWSISIELPIGRNDDCRIRQRAARIDLDQCGSDQNCQIASRSMRTGTGLWATLFFTAKRPDKNSTAVSRRTQATCNFCRRMQRYACAAGFAANFMSSSLPAPRSTKAMREIPDAVPSPTARAAQPDALILVSAQHPSRCRVHQVQSRTGGAGDRFICFLVALGRVVGGPGLHIQARVGASIEKCSHECHALKRPRPDRRKGNGSVKAARLSPESPRWAGHDHKRLGVRRFDVDQWNHSSPGHPHLRDTANQFFRSMIPKRKKPQSRGFLAPQA
jgi:hypothetical protein